MPVNLASPGIKVREVDLTVGRVDPSSANIGGLVAPFAQGPVDLPIIIGSEKDLLDNFGKPYNNDNHYEHWLSASSYLAYGAQMNVVRSDSDNLANAYANAGAASSIKIKSVEDYEIKQYDTNTINGKFVVSRNPGSWANGIRVGVIDSRADQIITLAEGATAGISTGDGVRQSTTPFTEDNLVIGNGDTTDLTGDFKGIVTGKDDTKNEIYVKFISHLPDANTETTQDYTYNGTFRFRSGHALSIVGAGAGTTSVQVTRGVLGETAATISAGVAITSYYLHHSATLDMQGGTTLASGDTVVGIATAMMGVTADDYLVIGNELISLNGATIGNGQISGVTRGVVGTAAGDHADGTPVKHLKRYAGIATVTEQVSDTGTEVKLNTASDVSDKVNAGGFLDLGGEFVSVTAFLNGGTSDVTPTGAKDWYDEQTLSISKETVGDTRVVKTVPWNQVADRPGTSEFAAERGSRFDELHVVIIDGEGKITGNAGTILEKHLNLSKATDAQYSVGSPSYWRGYLKTNSAYVFGGDSPEGVVASGFSSQYLASTDFAWDQDTEDSSSGPVIFGGAGAHNYELSGGTNYDGGSIIGSDGALASDLSKITTGYNLFTNKEKYDVDFLIMGSANYSKEKAASLASLLISVAGQRKDAVAFISPYRGAFLSESGNGTSNTLNNDETITNNVLAYYSMIPSSSYAIFDSGYKYMYDRFANTFRYVPLNGDIAGLCARNDIDNFPWFSSAGTSRGAILNAVKLAYTPNQSQRDRLYSERINPVIFSPGAGIVLFGDKTGLAKASAFDRINVRRLFIFLEDAISAAARDQLFEFNDEITRTNFVNVVEPFLRDVQAKRGIQDYVVICDETNNTGAVIDNNEFVADIYIKPARSINFIGLSFVATRSGVSFDEVIGNV